jgi:NTP pyrophosphatase (non-canonical NTP hydrolase)
MIHIKAFHPAVEELVNKYATVKDADYLADKLIEEMAELTQAIIKYRISKNSVKFAELEGEFADVLVHMALLQEKFMLFPDCKKRLEKIEKHYREVVQ